MKKRIAILMAAAIMTILAACGAKEPVQETVETTIAPIETETAVPQETEPAEEQPEYVGIVFATTDIDGNSVDETLFQGCKLVMLNFWEPWCGPCVGEMPELQRISEEYAEQGVLLVGVYSTESGAKEVLQNVGITYPVIRYTNELECYTTEYVPTTVFLGPDGSRIGQTVIGAQSYEAWKALLDSLL